jgi:hypothetical protein
MKNIAKYSICVGLAIWLSTLSADGANLNGEGVVRAEGTGSVWFTGSGWAEFEMDGEGTLKVSRSPDLKVTVRGSGAALREGGTFSYIGYDGTVRLESKMLAAYFTGGKVKLKARGHATMTFVGKGTHVIDNASSAWKIDGISVKLGKPRDDSATVWADDDDEEATTYESVEQPAVTRSSSSYIIVGSWPWYYSSSSRYRYGSSYRYYRYRGSRPNRVIVTPRYRSRTTTRRPLSYGRHNPRVKHSTAPPKHRARTTTRSRPSSRSGSRSTGSSRSGRTRSSGSRGGSSRSRR